MSKRTGLLVWVACGGLAMFAVARPALRADEPPSSSSSQQENTLLVQGKLAKNDRAAAEPWVVYIVYRKAGVIVWDVDQQDKLLNPHAKTDPEGKFTIRVPLGFLGRVPKLGLKAPEFDQRKHRPGLTVVILSPSDTEPLRPLRCKILLDNSGKPILLPCEPQARRYDLGTLDVEKARGPSTVALRDPEGGLRVGGSFIIDHSQ